MYILQVPMEFMFEDAAFQKRVVAIVIDRERLPAVEPFSPEFFPSVAILRDWDPRLD